MVRAWVVVVVVAAGAGLAGCGDDPATNAAGDASPAVPDALPPGTDVLEVTIGPVVVDAGMEDTVCVVVPLGNTAPAAIRAVDTRLSPGTHHVIVHLSDEPEQREPRGCGAFAGAGHQDLLFIAQQPVAEVRYPEGTGLPVVAGQNVHLEMHFFNYLPGDSAEISAQVRIEVSRESIDDLRPVSLLFTGGTGGQIPANSTATWRSFNQVPAGAQIFGLTTHMHQLGVRGTIHRGAGEDDPDAVLLYETTSWDEAPLQLYPPFTLGADEGLILRCDYDNPTDEVVGFGLGFEDEMCFLWAHLIAP